MGNFSFMLSELKFGRRVFAAICALLLVQNLAQGQSHEFRKVIATGAGLDADGALKNAFKVAVEEAVVGLVGERVGAEVVGRRGVGEGAVDRQHQRAVDGAADQRGGQRHDPRTARRPAKRALWSGSRSACGRGT